MAGPFSLSRTERIKSSKMIDTLFQHGKAFFVFPYKIIYQFAPALEVVADPLQAGFLVPKRLFRKANRRNRIRRMTKEAYRLAKNPLKQELQAAGIGLRWLLIYTTAEEIPFTDAQKAMGKIIQKVSGLMPGKASEKVAGK